MDLPRIGKPAPTFTGKAVLNDKVYNVSSSDYANRYLILLFFPMDFAYVCPTELIAFSDHLNDLDELNTNIIACSVESHLSHLKWLSTPHKEGGIRGLRIPLIADKTMAITKKYGVLNDDEGTAFRAMFIIDDKGILRQITINDRPVGRSISEACRLIKDIQHADKLRESASCLGFPEVIRTSISKHQPSLFIEKTLRHELTE